MFRTRSLLPFLLVAVSLGANLPTAHAAPPSEPLEIVRMTPSGDDVPTGKQVVFEFSRAVVPVGRMERTPEEIPITITPALACEWRWLNTTTLACQLGDDQGLKPATKYQVVVKPGIKAEDGATIKAPFKSTFITLRPKATYTIFRKWLSPEMPAIALNFNVEVKKDSVEKHTYFVTGGKKVGVTIEELDEWDAKNPYIEEEGEEYESEEESDDEGAPEVATPTPTPTTTPVGILLKDYSRSWVITPKTSLPADTEINIVVEPGVEAVAGPEKSNEQEIPLTFHTFPKFSFVGIRCWSNAAKENILFPPAPDGKDIGGCDPLSPVMMVFTGPVLKDDLSPHLGVVPDLAGGRTDYKPWESVYSYSRVRSPYDPDDEYGVNLPFGLKANQRYDLKAPAGTIKDEFGRTIDTPISTSFITSHRVSKFTFEDSISTLEKGVASHLPIAVTNLDSLSFEYQTKTAAGSSNSSQKQVVALDRPENVAYYHPVKIRDFLGGKSGVVKGSFVASPLTDEGPQRIFSQVTPFAVHLKLGHFDSLAWVTDMATGEAVSGARVSVFKEPQMSFAATPAELSTGTTDQSGVARLAGTETIDPQLSIERWWSSSENPELLFAQVTKGEDIAIVPVISSVEVDARGPGGSWLSQVARKKYGHLRAWGMTPQGVYKLGDTVDFKFFVRNESSKSLVVAPLETYQLKVIDPLGKEVYVQNEVRLTEFGSYTGSFTVPTNGAVGYYRFSLTSANALDGRDLEPMQVLISDFTPSSFRVTTDLSGKLFKTEDTVNVTTLAKLHAGGPYAEGKSKVVAQISPRPIPAPPAQFSNYIFDTSKSYEAQTIHESENILDAQGELRTSFDLSSATVVFGELLVESSVQDDRGRSIAGRATAQFSGRDRFIGLESKVWTLEKGKPATVGVLVVDETGKPIAGSEYSVAVSYTRVKASRVKGPGNAFVTQYSKEKVAVTTCKDLSKVESSACVFTPAEPGVYSIVGTIRDTKGRKHTTRMSKYAVGEGAMIWEENSGYQLDIVAEKPDYKVGDTARFLVKNPLPGALALVTVERYGIQKSWTQKFDRNTEVIEFPITPDHIPGFYLSVVLHSPRVDKPIDENQVDLGKPALRAGYVEVPVADPSKRITITAKSDREVYRPREKVSVNFKVSLPLGRTDRSELAVAVLDEGVFDLISRGADYFDAYKGLYSLDGLDVRSYDLLLELIGRRKFEKKGANSGGDGGGQMKMRSLIKFLSYWNGNVPLAADGTATISFEAPDNLTGWRILAIAASKNDLFGLGQATFKVNQELEIRPALPNQVSELDSFGAQFTVMNRTDVDRKLHVTIDATGPIDGSVHSELDIETKPFERAKVSVPVNPARDGEITFIVKATDGTFSDALTTKLRVLKRATLETAATYGTTIEKQAKESFSIPSAIRTDVGNVSVVLSPSVISNVTGAFSYMRDYPYICWEQKLSTGVMAAHYKGLRDYLPTSFSWPESDTLPQTTLDQAANFQAPNGGMTYFIPKDDYVDAYLSAYTAIAFNWMRELGLKVSKPVEDNLDTYLLEMLRKDVMPSFYSKGMASTVRAVALYALAERGKVTKEDLARYLPQAKSMSLFGKAHLLMAAAKLGAEVDVQKGILNAILTHANESGGKFVFSEQLDDGYERMLTSSLRDNCAVVSAMLNVPELKTLVGDKPFKVVRMITQSRKSRDHWENTQENLFCTRALLNYSKVYESEPPVMKVTVDFAGTRIGESEFKTVRDPSQELQRSIVQSDAGKKAEMTISRDGTGRLYYSARLKYAPKELKKDPVNSGIQIQRQYSVERNKKWELLSKSGGLKSGDLVRVDLYVSVPAARNFVVVNDPVPGGLEPVNRDLATSSRIDADKGELPMAGGAIYWDFRDWITFGVSRWSFYHKELRHESVRFYAEYLPAGKYHLAYVAQVIAPGTFTARASEVEEMYDPDVFGKGVPEVISVN